MTGKEIVDIITAVGQTLVMVIAAVGAILASRKVGQLQAQSATRSDRHDEKLDRIEGQTNGVQYDLRTQITTLEGRIERLYLLIAAVSPNTRALEQATVTAAKIAETVAVPVPVPVPETPLRTEETAEESKER